jgi:hypothetical protein
MVAMQTARFLPDLVAREAPDIVISQTTELRIGWPKEEGQRGAPSHPLDGHVPGLDALYASLPAPYMAVTPWLSIDFTQGGNSDNYCTEGWSGAEPTHRWGVGTISALRIPPPPTASPPPSRYILTVDMCPYLVPGHIETQSLEVLVNGVTIASVVLDSPRAISVKMNANIIRDHGCVITFRHPDASSPFDQGVPDRRVLAVSFTSLTISSQPRAWNFEQMR